MLLCMYSFTAFNMYKQYATVGTAHSSYVYKVAWFQSSSSVSFNNLYVTKCAATRVVVFSAPPFLIKRGDAFL
jgi:hypothetical protein